MALEDPVAWITEGGWNSVQDYGLGIWWESGSDVIRTAIETGDPRPIEHALRDYHDRVVATGGTLYQYAPKFKDAARQAFATAVVAAVGNLLGAHYPDDFPLAPETTRLLELKRQHAALQQLSTRRQIPTNAEDKNLRVPPHGRRSLGAHPGRDKLPERPGDGNTRLSGIATTGLTNLSTSAAIPAGEALSGPAAVRLRAVPRAVTHRGAIPGNSLVRGAERAEERRDIDTEGAEVHRRRASALGGLRNLALKFGSATSVLTPALRPSPGARRGQARRGSRGRRDDINAESAEYAEDEQILGELCNLCVEIRLCDLRVNTGSASVAARTSWGRRAEGAEDAETILTTRARSTQRTNRPSANSAISALKPALRAPLLKAALRPSPAGLQVVCRT